jgi:nucleotide-binding universal stress UspA family protein
VVQAVSCCQKTFELIANGPRGRSGLKQWLLGRVVGQVLAQSTRAVLVVR